MYNARTTDIVRTNKQTRNTHTRPKQTPRRVDHYLLIYLLIMSKHYIDS